MLSLVGGTTTQSQASDVTIVIPARHGSTRFPGKPLAPLRGVTGIAKSLLQRSWEAASSIQLANNVVIATDDPRIADIAAGFGAEATLTSTACRNGTERCLEALVTAGLSGQIVVNFQGDAPLTPPLAVEALIEAMLEDPNIDAASPMIRCSPLQLDRLLADARAGQVGGTTVVCDAASDALYFSKRVIPYVPERSANPPVFLHMGLYAYRRPSLERYGTLEPSALELAEGLEQLRFLDAGIPIRMIEVADPPGGLWEVNNPADIVPVEAALAARRIV